MNDLATIHGAPRAIRTGSGRTYLAYPITLRDHGRLQAWIDDKQELRLLALVERLAARNAVSVEVQKYGIEAALKIAARHRVLLGTAEANELLDSIEGKVFLAWLAISKGDPRFTLDDAWALAQDETAETIDRAAEAADALRADAPKAAAAPGGSSPTAAP